MDGSPDFRDLLSALKNEGVRFLVVGAYAVIHHSEPRYTKDLDVWVEPTHVNARRVWRALASFGAPLKAAQPADFADEESFYSLGIEPNRIDVLMSLEGVRFATAWKNRVVGDFAGIAVPVLSRSDLIRAKLASARPQDLLDVSVLRLRPRKIVVKQRARVRKRESRR